MEITEVRVKLTSSQSDRVRAFCSVTFDREFVVRDIKVIEGTNGLFVAMPSRKMADHCPKCRSKNHLRARFCNECGNKLRENRAAQDGSGRSKLHADIAHPINMACRERLQQAILAAYEEETGRAEEPGYEPPRPDSGAEYDNGADYAALVAELRAERPGRDERPEPQDEPHEGPQDEPHEEPQDEHHEEAPQDEPSEPAESEPAGSEPAKPGHEFGKGIL